MEPKTNYSVVGLTVLLLVAGLIATSLWLSVGFNKKKYKVYAAYFRESVGGINEESQVKFNGVQVGSVLKIQLSPNDPQQVKVLLNIEEDTPITTSTVATLVSQGITGISYLGLTASSADLTPLTQLPNEPYPIIPTKPSLFNQLDHVIHDVSDNINRVADKLNLLLNDENRYNVKKTLANFRKITEVIIDNKTNIDQTLKNLSNASVELPKTIQEFKKAMTNLGKMATQVGVAGRKFGATMDSGKAVIHKISQQTIPPANQLIHRLNDIAANLQQVSTELKQNPSIIIRGTKPPKSGPGE